MGNIMYNLQLSIDLLPKGAWGNNLSTTLPQKDWDTLRETCYKKALNMCSICGQSGAELHAHEVWEFDIAAKTQTLKDIVALCSACHGVKHMRNSERTGYGEQAKAHFIKINRCSPQDFEWHYEQAKNLFEERNKIERWKLIADLDKFGGKGIKVIQRQIPIIINPYEDVDWANAGRVKVVSHKVVLPPRISLVEVDNYQGIIKVVAYGTNKIQWFSDEKLIKQKFNFGGKFTTEFSVGNLKGSYLSFKLVGSGGITLSQQFKLQSIDYNRKEVI